MRWGSTEFLRRGLICKRLRDYEPKHSECLCFELTFTNEKWICFSIYRPPESRHILKFFEELTISLSKAIWKLLIMGIFSIDVKSKSLQYDKLRRGHSFWKRLVKKCLICHAPKKVGREENFQLSNASRSQPFLRIFKEFPILSSPEQTTIAPLVFWGFS